MSPQVLALILGSAGVGGLVGWVLKALLGGARSTANEELKLAVEDLERALKTPTPDDDVKARERVAMVRRIKALVDGVPNPPQ